MEVFEISYNEGIRQLNNFFMPHQSFKNGLFCPQHFVIAVLELVGGCDDSEGNLFAYNPVTNFYGPVCDDGWDPPSVSISPQ